LKRIVNFSLSVFNEYQFIRFLFVGGINTIFGYSCFAFFIFLNFHYALASVFATICGIFFNFITVGSIVFYNKDKKLIFKFFGVYGITCVCSIIILKIFNYFLINNYIGGAALILPMAILSFILNKKFVFVETQ
jgi:putative flippase GtrA